MDFKVAMLAALDKTTLMRISDPITRTRHLTCGAILRDMEATVGTFSPSNHAANEAKLRDPYNPTDNINNFLSTHIGAHATAAANLQPFSDSNKVKFLLEGLAQCNLYRDKINLWLMQNPTVASQTFSDLAKAIRIFDATRDRAPQARALGYSAAIRSETSQLSDADLSRLAVAVSKLNSTTVTRRRANSRPVRNFNVTPSTKKTYCWTHGPDRSITATSGAMAPRRVRAAVTPRRATKLRQRLRTTWVEPDGGGLE